MTVAGKYLRWIWWTLAYLFVPRSKDLRGFLLRGERTRPPWWRFRPHVHRNEDGRRWEVWLADEQAYTESGTVPAEIHRSMEDGRIVGFMVLDESLKGE